MTNYEVLKLMSEAMGGLERAGAKPGDYKYLRLFEDYAEAIERGEKVSYVVAVLADRYNVSERTVYDVVKRLQMRFSMK